MQLRTVGGSVEHVVDIEDTEDTASQLSELVAVAEKGEAVVIARGGKPVARLVPVAVRPQPQFGAWMDRLPDLGPEAFAPMSDEEAADWEEQQLRALLEAFGAKQAEVLVQLDRTDAALAAALAYFAAKPPG
jgi:antitoxin (DNA-binding transcriptional repressor) of toxin-antitoxin stability system